MSQTVQATFDGQVLKPEQPLELAPNTRVLITIEVIDQPVSCRGAFLRTARSLKVDGPADWSEKSILIFMTIVIPNRVFLDTSYAIALVSAKDDHHEREIALSLQLETDNTELVTTRAILLEVGNALSKRRYREVSVQLLAEVETDPQVEIVPVTESLYYRSFRLYQARTDKEWGITDCLSFVVMQEQGLTKALTADVHFQQAGFRALLREN